MSNKYFSLCLWIQDKLLDFPDSLSEHEKAQVEQHLAHCSSCQTIFQENRKLKQILQKDHLSAPENLRKALIQRFHRDFSKNKIRQSWPKPLHVRLYHLATAVLMIIGICIYLFYEHTKESSVPKLASSKLDTLCPQRYVRSKVSNDTPYDNGKTVLRVQVDFPGPECKESFDPSQATEDDHKEYNWQVTVVTYNPNTNPEGAIAKNN